MEAWGKGGGGDDEGGGSRGQRQGQNSFRKLECSGRFNTGRDEMVDVRSGQPITASGQPPAKGSHVAPLTGGSSRTLRRSHWMSDGLFSVLVLQSFFL